MIRIAQSVANDAHTAVEELHAGLCGRDDELVIFFCSAHYDLDLVATHIRRLFKTAHVIGCTSAGEIGPLGYKDHSLTGLSFPAGSCVASSALLPNLKTFDPATGRHFAGDLLTNLMARSPQVTPRNTFGLVLIDGLSMREQSVAHTLQSELSGIALFGGSAGDALKLERTHVYANGAFHTDAAVAVLISTPLPFKIFKTEHFTATETRMVVTDADPTRRVVREINGLPAAEEYARMIGAEIGQLTPDRFAAAPLLVRIGGHDYVRSIQKANPDGSLTMFSAIDEGLVLRLGRGVDMVENLEAALTDVRADIGQPQVIIGCDCILRGIEASSRGTKAQCEALFQGNRLVGFNSYGEQYHHVHVNQTLTGCAIGTVAGGAVAHV